MRARNPGVRAGVIVAAPGPHRSPLHIAPHDLPPGGGGPRMPVDDELASFWPAIRAQLERAVPASVYQVWLERVEPVQLRGHTPVLAAPEPYRRHIAGRFARVLQTSAAAVLGPEVEVDVVGHAPRGGLAKQRPTQASPAGELNPEYTFEQFVIGEG